MNFSPLVFVKKTATILSLQARSAVNPPTTAWIASRARCCSVVRNTRWTTRRSCCGAARWGTLTGASDWCCLQVKTAPRGLEKNSTKTHLFFWFHIGCLRTLLMLLHRSGHKADAELRQEYVQEDQCRPPDERPGCLRESLFSNSLCLMESSPE